MVELSEQQKRIVGQFLDRGEPIVVACGCMGVGANQPLCPCSMMWVIEDEGHYHRVTKVREGLTIYYMSEDIGPVGGPYTVDTHGRPFDPNDVGRHEVDESALSLKERLMLRHGDKLSRKGTGE